MIPARSMDLHARLAALYAELAALHRELARDVGDQYVDQRSSPLGKRLHCRAVRSGALPGFRAGRRILVRRADLEAYLERHRITPTEGALGTQDQDEALLAKYGGRAA